MHNITSPRTDDDGIEAEIKAKGLTAPRVTPADIEANITSEHYFTALDGRMAGGCSVFHPSCVATMAGAVADVQPVLGRLTFCVLELSNGFMVTGESACASPDNFDEELGRKIARANAVNKVWPLLGFRLRDQLHASATQFD